jgi:hypothetical protein
MLWWEDFVHSCSLVFASNHENPELPLTNLGQMELHKSAANDPLPSITTICQSPPITTICQFL